MSYQCSLTNSITLYFFIYSSDMKVQTVKDVNFASRVSFVKDLRPSNRSGKVSAIANTTPIMISLPIDELFKRHYQGLYTHNLLILTLLFIRFGQNTEFSLVKH